MVEKNRKSTLRFRIWGILYPLIKFFGRRWKNGLILKNKGKEGEVSFYTLSAIKNNGGSLEFSSLKGKYVLIVNTAGGCGYTRQFEELQKLQNNFSDSLVILGFPSNDFNQEHLNDQEIERFCRSNFGISFQLMKKCSVKKGTEQHPVYQWLTNSGQNGWNTHDPDWNFGKYLVNPKGKLIGFWGTAISPLDGSLLKSLKEE